MPREAGRGPSSGLFTSRPSPFPPARRFLLVFHAPSIGRQFSISLSIEPSRPSCAAPSDSFVDHPSLFYSSARTKGPFLVLSDLVNLPLGRSVSPLPLRSALCIDFARYIFLYLCSRLSSPLFCSASFLLCRYLSRLFFILFSSSPPFCITPFLRYFFIFFFRSAPSSSWCNLVWSSLLSFSLYPFSSSHSYPCVRSSRLLRFLHHRFSSAPDSSDLFSHFDG